MNEQVTLKNMINYPHEYQHVICYRNEQNMRVVYFHYLDRVFKLTGHFIEVQGNDEVFLDPLEELNDSQIRDLVVNIHNFSF